MNSMHIYLLLAVGVISIITMVLLLFQSNSRQNQREFLKPNFDEGKSGFKGLKSDAFTKAQEASGDPSQTKSLNSSLTIEKKLKYAQWKIDVRTFRIIAWTLGVIFYFLARIKLNIVLQFLALFMGPFLMDSLLMYSVNARFKKFDRDYPQFLLQLVGLLKTGMNPMQGIKSVAEGMDPGSLIRIEAELMLERLRIGVAEDMSIGAFGEDVYHSEIELFVQALLLSRRVGGTLSDTLDRLARQVRRRSYFREQAVAAVGLQRGSIWFIIAIIVALQSYIYFVMPAFITDALNDPNGWQAYQGGFLVIITGLYWVKQVTKIRV